MTDAAALILASHGTSDAAGRRAVAALVDSVCRIPWRSGVTPGVTGCFVDVQQPDVPSALDSVPPGGSAVIVPLLLSAGYHVHHDLAEASHDAPLAAHVAGALGPDARLAEIQATRLHQLGLRDDDIVVMAAAGSSDASAVIDCERAGQLLQARLGREVTTAYLSAVGPRLHEAVSIARGRADGRRVVVSTYLLAPGYFADLVARSGADAVSAPLLVDGAAPPNELVEVILDRYRLALCRVTRSRLDSLAPSRSDSDLVGSPA